MLASNVKYKKETTFCPMDAVVINAVFFATDVLIHTLYGQTLILAIKKATLSYEVACFFD